MAEDNVTINDVYNYYHRYNGYIVKELPMFLDKLANIAPYELIDDKEYLEQLIRKVKSFYDNNDRHYYSDISKYCYNSDNTKLEYILENLKLIKSRMEDMSEDEDCIIKLTKLIDHIRLEFFRNGNLEDRIMTDTVNFLNEKSTPIDDKLDKTIEKRLKELNFEVISIISIFSAIIMAFFGGLSFLGEALANMNSVDIELTLNVIIAVGICMYNIFYIFFKFVSVILEKDFIRKRYFYIVNLVMGALFFLTNISIKNIG